MKYNDATYIIDQHHQSLKLDDKLGDLNGAFLTSVNEGLQPLDARVTKPERFLEEFHGSFFSDFRQKMRHEAIAIYIRLFSKQELADLANFLKGTHSQAQQAGTQSWENLVTSSAFLLKDQAELLPNISPNL
jgi:hypothetical protein